jgi:fatty acid desaturase
MAAKHLEQENSLSDPEFKAQLQRLRQSDNVTNWYYLARTYLYLVIVLATAVATLEWVRTDGLGWGWGIPVVLVAIVLVGAGQHQLSGLAHEGVHHILFWNRWLNDLASDLLTMFPVFGATHLYRLQHLAHHQFVNDPDRDPDVSQLRTSGHWLAFPVSKRHFLLMLLKQLWVPNLIRFTRVRAKYNATGTDKNPYVRKGQKQSRLAVLIGGLYLAAISGTLTGLFYFGDPVLLVAVPAGMWAAICLVYWRLPADKFNQSRLHPVVPLRYMTMLRLGYVTVVFTALANIQHYTGIPAAFYYLVLWLVPIFSSFAFFMILRQIVQHGNADRSWVTNTRTFFVHRIINFAVFPMGQDYHLPHHMYATVPHYRLGRLHELLMACPEYRDQAVVVEGYFAPPHRPQSRPTVLDVLGPEYATRSREIYVDNTVLEDDEVDEKEAILREEAVVKAEGKQAHGR